MKNIGKHILHLIFGPVVILWAGFALPQEFGLIDTAKQGQPDAYQEKYIREAYRVDLDSGNNVKKLLKERSTEGFYGDAEYVLKEMYEALDAIITPDMTDADKVRAIHDYLICNADYYEGDLATRPGWSSAMEGVLVKGTGVCNSYALVFYAMCTAEDIDCHMVAGTTSGENSAGDHAWNRVRLGDSWYYIDCTWDDPIGGGYECYDYYLTAALWPDHFVMEEYDPGEEADQIWQDYYLTGDEW